LQPWILDGGSQQEGILSFNGFLVQSPTMDIVDSVIPMQQVRGRVRRGLRWGGCTEGLSQRPA